MYTLSVEGHTRRLQKQITPLSTKHNELKCQTYKSRYETHATSKVAHTSYIHISLPITLLVLLFTWTSKTAASIGYNDIKWIS